MDDDCDNDWVRQKSGATVNGETEAAFWPAVAGDEGKERQEEKDRK